MDKSILNGPKCYPGLFHTAKFIGPYIHKSKIYVECFAGLARTAKYARSEIIILNDTSPVSNDYCKRNFINAIVENMDFIKTIKKYDSKDTFFLIDPPWRLSYYEGNKKFRSKIGFTKRPGEQNIARTAKEYVLKLKEILPSLKGNWILTLGPSFHTHFKEYYATSVKAIQPKLFGYYPKTYLFSNKPLEIQILTLEKFLK